MHGNGAMRRIGASLLGVLDTMLPMSVGVVVNLGQHMEQASSMQEELKCHTRTGQGQRMRCVIWRNSSSKMMW